jgi:transposase
MGHLSQEARQMIVEKVLTDKSKTVKEWSQQHNIGYSTLQKWLQRYRNGKPSTKGIASALTPSERFEHLLMTATLDETAVGVYCRKQGLYSHQLRQWKDEFMAKNNEQKNNQQQSELKALRAENKLLKQDLRRKEKALAETTALLVLKKKAALLWGEPEDV